MIAPAENGDDAGARGGAVVTWLRSSAAPIVVGILLALAARLALIWLVPHNYSFDGYQRWAGRAHLLVQDWLPATQVVLWGVDLVGGGVLAARVALSVVAAGATGAAIAVAQRVGGQHAAWLFLPVTLFSPFLCWSVVPYQEPTFLLLSLGAVALALRAGDPRDAGISADLVAGSLALVRYEGWPFVLLYIVWRRRPRALLAAWGMVVWLSLRLGFGVEGYASSPVDFKDWAGLGERFSWAEYGESALKLSAQSWDTGLWVVLVAGLAGGAWAIWRRRPGAVLLGLLLGSQLAATAGWMAGLETATFRMQVIPGVLLGLFAAVGAGALWRRWPRWAPRTTLVIAGAALAVVGFNHASWMGGRSVRSVKWERKVITAIESEPDEVWRVKPRTGIGTRDRHDGCEAIQGQSRLLHGVDFWCSGWPGRPDARVTREAVWKKGGYVIRESSGG